MELLSDLYILLEKWIFEFSTISGGLQLATVVGCAGLALLTHQRWQTYITRLLGNFEQQGFFQFILRGTDRAAFPMSMLIYIIVFRFVLDQFGVNVKVLEVFTPLLISLAAIRITIYVLRRGFTPSLALTAWEHFISLSIWGYVALHLFGWLPTILTKLDEIAMNFGESRFSLLSLIQLILAVLIFMVIAAWLSRFIESKARRSPHISPSMRVGLTKVSKFFLYLLAFILALTSVGIDLTTFTVFSGAMGVGIGFGLQRIASNFISGFILLFDRSIRPGDVISIGDRFGWVQALHARYIVVRDRDGVETLIPNENLITSEVTNWSYSDRMIRIRIPVQASYDDDPEVVLKILGEACSGQKRVLDNPKPVTRLIKFDDSGINYELRVWVRDPESGLGNIRSNILLAVWKGFKKHGITIPFPQRDVRIVSNPDSKTE